MRNLYHEAEKKAKEVAESCEITDSCEITKMICEEMKREMVEIGKTLADALNVMGNDVQEAVQEGLLEGLQRSHRELQSNFWQSMLVVIKKYGDSDLFDGRNEWATKMCKRMAVAAEKWSE